MTTASPQRTLWLAAGAIVAVLFTLCAAQALVGWTVGTVSKNEHRVLSGNVKSVRIDGAFSDLTLAPTSGSQVVVDSDARGSLWLPKVRTKVDGDHVSISGNCHLVVFGNCSADFVVHVPAGMPVTVTTGSGDVHADGLSGPVTLEVSSGDVELHRLTGGATASVSSGDIAADDLQGVVELRSSSGDISAAEMHSPSITAQARSGDVFVDAMDAPERLEASATSGDVEVTVPRGHSYDAEVVTISGDHSMNIASDPSAARRIRVEARSGDADLRYR